MADTDDEPIIRAYIDRMLAIADADDEPDQAMLESIATELGLSADDVRRANGIAADHHKRARHYIEVSRWDDAIAELTQAIALRPQEPDVRFALAEAHAGRWADDGRSADKQQAERAIRKVLEQQPDRKEAYALLQRLDKPRSGRRNALWIGMAGVVGLVAVMVSLDDGFLRPDKMLRKALRSATRPAVVAGQTAGSDYSPVSEVDIPFQWDDSDKGQGLRASVRVSRLTRHKEPSLYNYAVLLTNQGHAVIDKLTVRLTYRSSGGAPLKEETVELLNSAYVPMRPGDELATGSMRLVPKETASVKASVVMRDEVEAPAAFEPGTPEPVTWTVAKPGHVAIDVRKRYESLKPFLAGDKKSYEGHFELHNLGKGAISELEMAADILDRQDHVLKTLTRSVVLGRGRELGPGHVCTFEFFEFLGPTASDHVRLRVTDVR
jgi:tetratricopeptide (TPR) repeat protein